MTAPLPSSGPERTLLVRALAVYSDNCTSPSLSPDCPFYEVNVDGPVCGEQCKDVLADVGTLDAGGHELDAQHDAIRVYRRPPRPRRGPSARQKAFDAGELYRTDRDKPIEKRSTSALLQELSTLLVKPIAAADPREDTYALGSVLDELHRRGVPAERVIRLGLANKIANSVCVFAVIGQVFSTEPWASALGTQPPGVAAPKFRSARWLPLVHAARAADEAAGVAFVPGPVPPLSRGDGLLLEAGHDAKPSDNVNLTLSDDEAQILYYATTSALRQRAVRWAATADLDDVLTWTPPAEAAFVAAADDHAVPVDRAARDRIRWVLDRFTNTYLDEWSLPSLEQEWRWQQGRATAPCLPETMRERLTIATDVSAAIADHAVAGNATAARSDGIAPTDFVQVALDALRDGRASEAAAMYSGLVALRPNDHEVVNNYGFCLMPTDMPKAYEVLLQASRITPEPNLTNVANRTLALLCLARPHDALRAAEESLQIPAEKAVAATLWQPDPPRAPTALQGVRHPHRYVAKLASTAAVALGDTAAADLWRQRGHVDHGPAGHGPRRTRP